MKTFVTQEMLSMWGQNPTVVLEDLAQAVFQAAVQEALKMLPLINENIIKQATVLHESSNKFYKNNPDLIAHKPFVAKMIETFEGQNPGRPIDEILDLAAKEARKNLKLQPAKTKKRLDDLDGIVGGL